MFIPRCFRLSEEKARGGRAVSVLFLEGRGRIHRARARELQRRELGRLVCIAHGYGARGGVCTVLACAHAGLTRGGG